MLATSGILSEVLRGDDGDEGGVEVDFVESDDLERNMVHEEKRSVGDSELVYVRSTDSKRSGLFGLLDTRIEGGIHPQQLAMINQLEVWRDVYHMRVRLPDNTAETTSLDGQARATWTQHNSSTH